MCVDVIRKGKEETHVEDREEGHIEKVVPLSRSGHVELWVCGRGTAHRLTELLKASAHARQTLTGVDHQC